MTCSSVKPARLHIHLPPGDGLYPFLEDFAAQVRAFTYRTHDYHFEILGLAESRSTRHRATLPALRALANLR